MLDPDKSKAPKNALTHGVYASDIVLPEESEEDFIALYNSFRGELNPDTPLENEVVLDIARLHWLKRRAIQSAKGEFIEKSAQDPAHFIERIKDLARGTGTFRKMMGHAIKSMRDILACLQAQQTGSEQCTEVFRQVEELQKDYIARIDAIGAFTQPRIERTYQPADLERVIKVEAMIDTRIEKALALLNRLRESRKLYGPKSLPS